MLRQTVYLIASNMKQADTIPPSTDADKRAAEFEAAISERGEDRARWDNWMALLEERWGVRE